MITRPVKVRPGDFVLVVATPGRADPVKSPPGSTVGIESLMNRPKTLNRGPNTSSIRISSWR